MKKVLRRAADRIWEILGPAVAGGSAVAAAHVALALLEASP